MKILFGGGNNTGSNIMISRFINNAPHHDIRVASYYRNHQYLNSIDWCLDSLYCTKVGDVNYFRNNHGVQGPHINHNLADLIINDLIEWGPDLIISDCEYFTAMVAKSLETTLWYCSSLLQLTGIIHDRKGINTRTLSKYIQNINSLPIGDRYLVYSPLCDVSSRPLLKDGFEWVRPYSKKPDLIRSEVLNFNKAIPSKDLLCTGETSFVSDCLYSGKKFFISPDPHEAEQIINAQLLQWYGAANNIGRPNSIGFALSQVERSQPPLKLSMQNWKQLDELL